MMLKLLSVLALFVGEALCIYSEMIVAKEPRWWWTFNAITLAGVPLLLGYHYGYRAFESMWPVMAISVVSILIVEPILIWGMFRETPSTSSMVALGLGVAGLGVAMFGSP